MAYEVCGVLFLALFAGSVIFWFGYIVGRDSKVRDKGRRDEY